ncbi:uncharacterized protein LOC142775702 [Rhipicephalus microplus]|uniref:uncharacterized protein LOC142775702 n=1 Tax=Rhipicephalus microplus TaxID=6941 RepID=UPI003F6D7DE5
MQCSNPLLFFMQILLGLLRLSSTAAQWDALQLQHLAPNTTIEGLPPHDVLRYRPCDGVPGGATLQFLEPADLSASRITAIKQAPQGPCGSGLGSNTKMQCSNPLLFFMQILLGLLRLSSTAAQWDALQLQHLAPNTTIEGLPPHDVLRYRPCDGVPGGATLQFLEPADLSASRITAIKQAPQGPCGSGLGSNTKMQCSNPLLFFMQILLGLLRLSSTAAQWDALQLQHLAPNTTIEGLPPHDVLRYRPCDGVPGGATLQFLEPADLSASRITAIKQAPQGPCGSGLGSNTKMQCSNPLLFFMQEDPLRK